jgi:hypothetical protein
MFVYIPKLALSTLFNSFSSALTPIEFNVEWEPFLPKILYEMIMKAISPFVLTCFRTKARDDTFFPNRCPL